MPGPELPITLKTAAEALVAGRGRDLRAGVAGLSRAYGEGRASGEDMDLGAYLATRLPATFAAISRCLGELRERVPEFEPQSLADVGAGPGTASWAAAEAFDTLRHFTFIDNNRSFLELATQLARQSSRLSEGLAIQADMARVVVSADLVIVAYALAEVPVQSVAAVTQNLWQAASGALMIVEPGTPAGFARIAAARLSLIAAGATLAAPCPGGGPCPMAGNDWCHFSARLPRSRLHRHAKSAVVPFEDEPYSYLIATRFPVAPVAGRILSPPRITKAAVAFKLCTSNGLELRSIAHRDSSSYKQAKKRSWGDAT